MVTRLSKIFVQLLSITVIDTPEEPTKETAMTNNTVPGRILDRFGIILSYTNTMLNHAKLDFTVFLPILIPYNTRLYSTLYRINTQEFEPEARGSLPCWGPCRAADLVARGTKFAITKPYGF